MQSMLEEEKPTPRKGDTAPNRFGIQISQKIESIFETISG
jgi:hypothetical protein